MATDENSILQFDWTLVEGKKITAMLGKGHLGASWREIAICLGDVGVMLRVNAETDEVIASLEPVRALTKAWKSIDILSDCVGGELFWSWTSRNSQGYLDMFTISLSDIDPQIAFVAAASTLSCRKLVEISAAR
ncbi:MAG TPA: DUF6334 family protein [Alphaproteobacteria bacterium]|jgi:hypothetical protein|nr:DUF6334 family protein [Alphaproteobacteria bacterium]